MAVVAVVSTGMPPSAAMATTQLASVLARRVFTGVTSSCSLFSKNWLTSDGISHHTAAARVSSGISLAATFGVSTSAMRRRGTAAAVRDGNFVNEKEMLVLGIETSCDDTGAAVVSADGRILGEAIASQAELLARWGGVVPKLAQEEHQKFIDKVVADALENAKVKESDLSAVAVTIGPGLSLCLRGGHNLLLLAKNVGDYVQLGTTIDDAIGEACDKSARWLGLDLKRGGGPALEEIAREGNPKSVPFSVPLREVQYRDCNFSYAGLKTQVRMAIEAKNIDGDQVPLSAASSED